MPTSTATPHGSASATDVRWLIDRRDVDVPDEARSLAPGAVILVVTDDGRASWSERTRHAAIELAHEIGGRLLLYDRSAESRLTDPYASGPMTADTASSDGDRLLDPAELRYLGREYLARQIAEASAAGVHAQAWLPRGVGRAALVEAARRFGADLIVVPAELRPQLGEPGHVTWRRRERETYPAPVLVSGADGSLWEWQLATDLSRVEFTVRQFGFLPVRGRFSSFEVRLEFDEKRPEATRVEARILASSLSTGLGIRDRDLRGPTFFDAARHPYVYFRSTSVTRSGRDYTVAGKLDIKGIRRDVELHGEFEGVGVARGYRRATMKATATIDRRDWGLTGGLFIDDRVTLAIDAVAIRASAEPSPAASGRSGRAMPS